MEETNSLIKYLDSHILFQEALQIVRLNNKNQNFYLVGSIVYQTLISQKYSTHIPFTQDMDIMTEAEIDFTSFVLPADSSWEIYSTGLGGMRLIRGAEQIDIFSLTSAISYVKTPPLEISVPEKLNLFFKRAPLNIQSILLDHNNKKVFGEIGLASINSKEISLYNKNECESYCQRHNISIEEFIKIKADRLGFKIV